LARLRFGVRVDKEGHFESDFHTVLDAARVPEKQSDSRNAVMTNRRYLADADFLVGLEGDPEMLQEIDDALRHPHWPLFLGRRAFAPSIPIAFPLRGPLAPPIRTGSLEEVLPSVPRLAHYSDEPELKDLRLILEVPVDQAYAVRLDQPIGSAFATREFATRGVRHSLLSAKDIVTVTM
jgi:CRISPR system Cascade subunit CasD